MTYLKRWDPFNELTNWNTRRLLEPFMNADATPESAMTSIFTPPPVDIYEDEHKIALKLEMPGMEEKDFDIRVENNTLTVNRERKLELRPAVVMGRAIGFN